MTQSWTSRKLSTLTICIHLEFGGNMSLGVIAVKNRHYRIVGLPRRTVHPLGYLGLHGASKQELDPWMRDVTELFAVNRYDAAMIEQIGKGARRTSPIRPGSCRLDQECGLDLGNRLLDQPQVQHVLPHRIAQPGRSREVRRVGDEVLEEPQIRPGPGAITHEPGGPRSGQSGQTCSAPRAGSRPSSGCVARRRQPRSAGSIGACSVAFRGITPDPGLGAVKVEGIARSRSKPSGPRNLKVG
jgi:hypothetical protein